MRRAALLVCLLTVGVVGSARADVIEEIGREEVTLRAPVPCAVLCPYWTDDLGHEGACAPEPATVPGSWADHRFTVPEQLSGHRPELLQVDVAIDTDYDNFLCRVNHPGTPDESWEEASCFCNIVQPPCDSSVGPIPLGCEETAMIQVDPGEVYVWRTYNWMDAGEARAVFRWLVVT